MTPIELWTCSICSITNESHKDWGPICKKTGRRVCDICCYRCEHHIGSSGIWHCSYKSRQEIRAAAIKSRKDAEAEEIARISEAYYIRRREEARKRAIRKYKSITKRKRA